MSNLRRTLSLRMSRRSYKTLPANNKFSSIAENQEQGSKTSHLNSIKAGTFSQVDTQAVSLQSTSTPMSVKPETGRKSVKQRGFPSLNAVKSALNNVKQKVKGIQMRKVRLGNTTSVTNTAYSTPRRSDRLKSKSCPSPISMKMYSPFCIETPGMEDSFIRLSKRKALTELNDSPLTKTPRRMVKAAVKKHKDLAKSISSSQVAVATSSGY